MANTNFHSPRFPTYNQKAVLTGTCQWSSTSSSFRAASLFFSTNSVASIGKLPELDDQLRLRVRQRPRLSRHGLFPLMLVETSHSLGSGKRNHQLQDSGGVRPVSCWPGIETQLSNS